MTDSTADAPTLQHVFTSTLDHLLRQGPATNEAGYCQYRTKNGDRCAVGFWLENYDPAIEDSSVMDEEVYTHLPKNMQYPAMLELLGALQVLHDSCFVTLADASGEAQKRALRVLNSRVARICATYSLTPPEPFHLSDVTFLQESAQ